MAVGIDIDAILKGLAFVADYTHEAADIFESELCMPNIKMPTMGGEVFWKDLACFNGYRLQQNDIIRHARILDPDNNRIAWGTVNGMVKTLERMEKLAEKYTEDGKLRPQKSITDVKDELETLKQLFDDGILTQSEFEERKKKVLAQVK